MKNVLSVLVAAFFFGAVSAQLSFAQNFKPTLAVQLPENVFAPMGFDNNDNAQVLLYGNLTDSCHKAGPVRFRVDKQRRTIYVRSEVYVYSGCWCADVMVPYLQTVNVGIMNAANYDIAVEAPDGTFKKMASMPIALASSASPDDFLYAPVDQVRLVKKQGSEPMEAILSGTFRNSCMFLKDVKVSYRANHVIEVLPIAEMSKGDCTQELRPFSVKVKLNENLTGRALLHVRSLNGQALNQVIDL